jgi:hypothetical protein
MTIDVLESNGHRKFKWSALLRCAVFAELEGRERERRPTGGGRNRHSCSIAKPSPVCRVACVGTGLLDTQSPVTPPRAVTLKSEANIKKT